MASTTRPNRPQEQNASEAEYARTMRGIRDEVEALDWAKFFGEEINDAVNALALAYSLPPVAIIMLLIFLAHTIAAGHPIQVGCISLPLPCPPGTHRD